MPLLTCSYDLLAYCRNQNDSESVSTGVWCVPGFGAGFEIALEPSKLQKEGENPGKGHFYFLRQTLVCTKPWFKRDLNDCVFPQRQLSRNPGCMHHKGNFSVQAPVMPQCVPLHTHPIPNNNDPERRQGSVQKNVKL